MGRIKGIDVILYEKIVSGTDAANNPTYEEQPIIIKNVLVAPASSADIVGDANLTGKKSLYTLAIPKEDSHEWTNRTVEFFGKKWRTVGEPLEGISELLPLDWNKKVMVERYE